ncbi:hypothetical protein SCOCK_200107 [Actinacidiphila cocklensis]|uniref:Uncharacterized protein n=1 Tax=Actinacidiphila cocklensis TaxID=887465 RepID=A0A9W4GSC9_9ACTN|nr:hypothetical protein SCOCK_200107 [Actinacidiphila cocklensis]
MVCTGVCAGPNRAVHGISLDCQWPALPLRRRYKPSCHGNAVAAESKGGGFHYASLRAHAHSRPRS